MSTPQGARISTAQLAAAVLFLAIGVTFLSVGLSLRTPSGFAITIIGFFMMCGGAVTLVSMQMRRLPNNRPTSAVGERYCPACGTGNARSYAFCQKCGKPLPKPT